jgi:hypothetical protein
VVTDVRPQDERLLLDVDCLLSTEDGPTTGVKFTLEVPSPHQSAISGPPARTGNTASG